MLGNIEVKRTRQGFKATFYAFGKIDGKRTTFSETRRSKQDAVDDVKAYAEAKGFEIEEVHDAVYF